MPYFTQLPDMGQSWSDAAQSDHLPQSVGIIWTGMTVMLKQWYTTVLGTLMGFLTSNWYLTVYSWGVILFAVPLFITDYLGYRKNAEFSDLYPEFPDTVKIFLIVVFFYLIVFLARRQSSEFLYFAF